MPKTSETGNDSLNWVRDELRGYARGIELDPLTNSVFAFAQRLFQRLEAGTLSFGILADLTNDIHLAAAERRVETLGVQHGLGLTHDPWAEIRAALSVCAAKNWDVFQAALHRDLGGMVFTAHPTFSLSYESRACIAKLASDGNRASRDALAAALKSDGGASSISLSAEHSEVQSVILQARAGIREFAELVVDIARTNFPDRWRILSLKLPTLASWVGYDLDGRTDIGWEQSLAFRLDEKTRQLDYYLQRLTQVRSAHAGGYKVDQIIGLVTAALALSQLERQAFSIAALDGGAIVQAVETVTSPNPHRITDAAVIISALLEVIRSDDTEDALACDLLALRAEVESAQLGTAHMHLRLNAAQIHTVISRDLGLKTEDAILGRIAMAQLAKLSTAHDREPVTFADLQKETSTARRQFMMANLILCHIDQGAPIRFLIAEAENPATVMGALYLATRYGVDHALDVSPLFETPDAMERGGRFMERLFDDNAFMSYVRRRGRVCVQFGFSDSGRYIGQAAAHLAIERLQILIGQAMARRDIGLPLLIFNTHGESMGRGAFPGSLAQRLEHVLTPWTRASFASMGISLQHETSYQGGDGYLHFMTIDLARPAVAVHCMAALSEETGTQPHADAFYDQTDFIWDMYRAMRAWHENLCADPDYAILLNSFATSFLAVSGSRQTRRPDASVGPRGLRAIPHNALLQQLAIPLNVACGLGASARGESDRLVELARSSRHFRDILELVISARRLTSVPALRGYASVYNPAYWIAISSLATEDAAESYRAIALQLRDYRTYTAVQRISDHISLDLSAFDRILGDIDGAITPGERRERRLDLHILHSVRQALMMRAMALCARIPRFSGRHDVSFDDLFALAMQMRLNEASHVLKNIFPASAPDAPGSSMNGYEDIRRGVIAELESIALIMRTISLAIGSFYGAYG